MTNTSTNTNTNTKSEFAVTLTNLLNSSRDAQREFFNSQVFNVEPHEYDQGEILEFKKELQENSIELKYEDNKGGEGQGENYWSVYSFTKGEEKLYVKFYGSYYSYDGSDYDAWFFVEPKQVIVTEFFRVK